MERYQAEQKRNAFELAYQRRDEYCRNTFELAGHGAL